jgi:DegV family protein with EDD domain
VGFGAGFDVVAIVADSAANLPIEVARELRIQVVPMYLNFGDRVYKDGEDLTQADFYRRLASGGSTPSTSTPTRADFQRAFESTGEREVVCVTVSSAMSASNHEAGFAAECFDGRMEVVDSKNASMAEGFVAMGAARCVRSGGGLDEAAHIARDLADRTTLVATVDTFEYLRRSGRVKKLQAYAATMLDIKPVFRFRQGEISPVARPRTRKRAVARVVEEAVEGTAGRPAHVAVVHAAAAEEAADVLARIASRADVVERVLVEATPLIGAHTGPGLVGVAFYTE